MKRMILIVTMLLSTQALADEMSYVDGNLQEEKLEVCIDTARDGVILETRLIQDSKVTLQWSMTAKLHCLLAKAYEEQTELSYFTCFCSTISKN